jgi:hypothetical protein
MRIGTTAGRFVPADDTVARSPAELFLDHGDLLRPGLALDGPAGSPPVHPPA